MSHKKDTSSELVELSKLNGDFHRNYGPLLGAYLYLRSISAARRHPFSWLGFMSLICSAVVGWIAKYGWTWWHTG